MAQEEKKDFLGQPFQITKCGTCGVKYRHMSIDKKKGQCAQCRNELDHPYLREVSNDK